MLDDGEPKMNTLLRVETFRLRDGNDSFENEARENKDRSTKHPNVENETPKFRNEAPKTRNHCTLKNYNFKSCMTQAEPGGGNGCVRTSKGLQIHPKVLF